MEKENINVPLLEALEGLKKYFIQQLTFNKLLLSKKMSLLSAGLLLFIILAVIVTLALLAFSSAFVYWFSYYFQQETYVGYLILTGFYIIIGMLIFIFRKKLLFDPLRKVYGSIFFAEENDEEKIVGIAPETFDNKENLNRTIEKTRNDLSAQEEELRVLFDQVSHQYTLKNITMQVAKNAYSSFVTTTNVAKAAFLLFNRMKGKKKKKHKKLKK